MTQTLCRYFSLLFKQNFASHRHVCFWLSTLTNLQVMFTFRNWGFDQTVLIVSFLPTLPIHVPKVTCSAVEATAKTLSLSASRYQPSSDEYLTKARIFKLHQPPVWSFHSPAIQEDAVLRLQFLLLGFSNVFYLALPSHLLETSKPGQVWQSSIFGVYAPSAVCQL